MRAVAELPSVEIRIVTGLHPAIGGSFDIYRPNGAAFGGPPFVYTEVWDNSWCIEEADRIERYDHYWQILWAKSISLREYLDDRRDRLA